MCVKREVNVRVHKPKGESKTKIIQEKKKITTTTTTTKI